jgi:hypothetical protein
MDEKSALNVLWIMFNGSMGLLLGLPQIAGLRMTTSPFDHQFFKNHDCSNFDGPNSTFFNKFF